MVEKTVSFADKEQAEATRFAFLQTFETKRSLTAHANLINYLGCSFRNGKSEFYR